MEKKQIRINARLVAEGYIPPETKVAAIHLDGDSLVIDYKRKAPARKSEAVGGGSRTGKSR